MWLEHKRATSETAQKIERLLRESFLAYLISYNEIAANFRSDIMTIFFWAYGKFFVYANNP